MNCPKCGAENISGSTFCIKCGANLKELQAMHDITINAPINEQFAQPTYEEYQNEPSMQQSIKIEPPVQQPINNEAPMQQSINIERPMQQPINNEAYMQQPINIEQPMQQFVNVSTASLNYLMYLIAVLLKPFKCFREEEAKLNNPKTSIILTVLVSAVMTVVNMIKTIFATVRVGSFSFTDGYTYSWEWDNLKDIKWVELIGKNFLIYACVIFVIALVFYLGSLIVKKQLSFIKSLSIIATAAIPAVVGIMILSPLGGMIWSPLSIVFMVVGAVYALVIFYELMNSELKLEGDSKIYFNVICFGILVVAGYYAYMNLFMNSVTDELDNLGNILDIFQ